MQRYPKSQSLVKRLKEGWRGDPPPRFKDLLKGRPEAGESDNKGSLTGRDLREQTKRRAGSFGVCLLPPDSQNKERLVRPRSQPGVSRCRPGRTPRALDAGGSLGRAMAPAAAARGGGGESELLAPSPHPPNACRSYGGLLLIQWRD